MKKKIIKGTADFKKIVSKNGYFVDKTMMIKEFIDCSDEVALITRPRRFGKTSNLSMIEYFFDINKKEEAHLFSEFKINEDKDFCQEHQNQYPVINLTLKSIKAATWEESYGDFVMIISNLYANYEYLLQSDTLNESQKENFNKILHRNASISEYKFSLKTLSRLLHIHHNKEVIMLMDEYDTPIINAYKKPHTDDNEENTHYTKVIEFMQTFLGQAYKDNLSMYKGLITGIMRIARESLFSELNNPGIFTIFSYYFADKFGFTQEETKEIVKYFLPNADFNDIKDWYNGYIIGDISDIYNPWSIVSYISNHREGFQPYWVNTGTDDLIQVLFAKHDEKFLREDLQKLIEGKTIIKEIETEFVFPNLQTNYDLIWSLLLFTGYLKALPKPPNTESKMTDRYHHLLIPNIELMHVYHGIIKYYFDKTIKFNHSRLDAMLKYLVTYNFENFEKLFSEFVYKLSYHDYAGEEAEQVFHAFTLGILVYLQSNYFIYSNIESGEGRPDIILIPEKKDERGFIFEFKKTQKDADEEKISTLTQEGFEQIQNYYYAEKIAEKGIKEYYEIVMVFAGKKATMKHMLKTTEKR